MNVPPEGLVSFSLYDASGDEISALPFTVEAPSLDEGYKTRFIFIGCTDEGAQNYLPEATISADVCVD